MEKKITFMIGLFDKDSHAQEHNTVSAYKLVQNLMVQEFWFGTIYESIWVYTHEDWTIVKEPTLVAFVITDKDYSEFVRLVKIALNQESIGVEEQLVSMKFM